VYEITEMPVAKSLVTELNYFEVKVIVEKVCIIRYVSNFGRTDRSRR
jgi:hypothetical protein